MGSKLGIIFAFLLAIAAAGGAYYLHKELTAVRGERVAIQQQYDEEKERALKLQSEKEQIKAAKEEYQFQSEKYQRDVQDAETKLNQIKTQTTQMTAEFEKKLKSKESMLAEMEKRVAELQRQAEEAAKACQVNPADVKTALEKDGGLTFGSSPTATVAKMPAAAVVQQPVLTGPRVLTVNRKFNFVVVNLGLKDGIKMGEQLKVFRAGVECATLQTEKLYDKFSAASIVKEDSSDPVREGDEVRKS
jgi:hypothetical protein